MSKVRPTFDDIFMESAVLISKRSTCNRRAVGAVAAIDNHIIAEGYNGAPRGTSHCTDIGECLREKLNVPSGHEQQICRGTHAEQNVICECARRGIKLDGATLYITDSPCSICTKLIINSGIRRIIYKNKYPDDLAFQLLEEAGIEISQHKD